MNREKMYHQMRENMPENLNEIEKAAYIMQEIGKSREFSSKYYWGDNKTRKKIYQMARKKSSIKLEDKRELICVTACKLYKYIAEKFDLDIYYTGDNGKITKNNLSVFETGEHISPVVKLKDGRFIKTDVEWDLENIQTGLRWVRFGNKTDFDTQLSELTQQEIDEIMKKIGYINEPEDYLDTYSDKLFEKLKGLNTKEKLKALFKDEKITKKVQKFTGSVEVFRFYRSMIKKLTKNESNKEKSNDYNEKVFIFGAYTKSKKKSHRYTICVYLNDPECKEENIWLWSKKAGSMVEVSPKELQYFVEKNKLKLVAGKAKKALGELLSFMNKSKDMSKTNNRSINEMVL